jgi:hypothetical protein
VEAGRVIDQQQIDFAKQYLATEEFKGITRFLPRGTGERI